MTNKIPSGLQRVWDITPNSHYNVFGYIPSFTTIYNEEEDPQDEYETILRNFSEYAQTINNDFDIVVLYPAYHNSIQLANLLNGLKEGMCISLKWNKNDSIVDSRALLAGYFNLLSGYKNKFKFIIDNVKTLEELKVIKKAREDGFKLFVKFEVVDPGLSPNEDYYKQIDQCSRIVKAVHYQKLDSVGNNFQEKFLRFMLSQDIHNK